MIENNKYPIVSGIPVPKRAHPGNGGRGGRGLKYPFDKLAIGEAFTFAESEVKRVQQAATRYARGKGLKFLVRKLPDQPGKAGCWRVEPKASALVQ
jgi:hypothetical protein